MIELTEMVKKLFSLKEEKAHLEALLKTCNKDIKQLAEREIPEMMEENEIEKFSVQGVGTVSVTNKVFAYVKKEHQDEFFQWLRDHGAEDLIRESVHSSTLNSFAKEQLSEGKELPDYMSTTVIPTASLRKG